MRNVQCLDSRIPNPESRFPNPDSRFPIPELAKEDKNQKRQKDEKKKRKKDEKKKRKKQTNTINESRIPIPELTNPEQHVILSLPKDPDTECTVSREQSVILSLRRIPMWNIQCLPSRMSS